MARTVTKKTDAVPATATVADEANVVRMQPARTETAADRLAKTYATRAFADFDDANAKGIDGTAAQRMAAACMLHRAACVKDDPEFPVWGSYLTNKDARKIIDTAMIDFFVPKMAKPKKSKKSAKQMMTNADHDLARQRQKHTQLVRRACQLVGILLKFGIERPDGHYNNDTGMWSVKPALLLEEGFEYAFHDGSAVPVNGKALAVINRKDEKTGKVFVSVQTMISMLGMNARGAGNTREAVSLDTVKQASIVMICLALKSKLDGSDEDAGDDDVEGEDWIPNREDFMEEDLNAISDLRQFLDTLLDSDEFNNKRKPVSAKRKSA